MWAVTTPDGSVANVTVTAAEFSRRDLFQMVRFDDGRLYEIAHMPAATVVRLVALSRREARLRRFGSWLARHRLAF